jgi:poly(3-hydroxybutyrate) depolymerase
MKNFITAAVVFGLALSQAYAKDSDRMLKKSFKTSSGMTLNYLLFVPANYSASQKYPLVVTLHGSGSDYIYQVDNNDQARPWLDDSVQAKWPHFFMAPGCPGGSWGGMMGAGTALSAEAKAVIDAIAELKKQYSLDSTRFVIGGFSLGGAGTYHMIQFLPDYWAAACPVAAGGNEKEIDVIAKTPIWHHQGLNDNGGAALTRMSTALEGKNYPTLHITCDMVVNSPSGWTSEINRGTKPQDILFKNSKPSYDSVGKAVDAGAKYIFQMINKASHEDSRLNANHNPLLAKWAFSKVKGSTTTISYAPVSLKVSASEATRYGVFMPFVNPVRAAAGPAFTVLGRTCRNDGAQSLVIRRVAEER